MKQNCCKRKNWVDKIASVLFCLILVGMVGVMSGCDDNLFSGFTDEDSFEYRLEDARIALDDQEYDVAIAILNALLADYPGNSRVLSYLASAQGGNAGLDTLDILAAIDSLSTNPNAGGIDIVGQVLGGADKTLTKAEIDNKIAQFDDAINSILAIPAGERTEDQKIQLGLFSFNHLVLSMAKVASGANGDSDIVLTEAGIASIPGTFTQADVNSEINTATITNDLNNINESIAAISAIAGPGNNDLTTEFNKIVAAIDKSGDSSVSDSEVSDYLNTL